MISRLARVGILARLWVITAIVLVGLCEHSVNAQSFSDLFPPTARKKVKRVKEKTSEEEALFAEETEEEKLVDAFVMRQVKFASDWNPDPTAMPQFLYQFRKALRMRARAVDEPIELSDPEVFKWPVLYMTAHNSFKFTRAERDGLKRYLEQGGVLIADDCSVGGGGWLPSLYSEINRIFPGQEWIAVTPDNKRFRRMFDLSFRYDSTIRIITRRHNQVFLVNDRIAIYLIHDDYGCMWEVSTPPSAADPLGISNHGFSSEERKECFEFCFNVLLYVLTH